MRRRFIIITIFLFSIISAEIFQPYAITAEPDSIVLEDFQNYGTNPFPEWSFEGDYNKAASIYRITEESGKKFLRGSTLKTNVMIQLGKQVNQNNLVGKNKVDWDISSFPFLSWEWRVKIIPKGGDENQGSKNDSAASVYVVFQRSRVPFAGWQKQPANWIKYVWSSTLPVGTVVSKKLTKFGMTLYEGKYIVVASGEKNLGKWITFKRNVLADYITHFGKKPAFNPIVVGIVTDSNSTKSQAEADYDNIVVHRN